MTKQDIAEQYSAAIQGLEIAKLGELMHTDIVVRFPQSGETIRGRDNYLATFENYPGLPDTDMSSVTGDEKTASIPSALPFGSPTITVFGGDRFIVEGKARYPNGDIYHTVTFLTIRDQKVIEETAYFAAPFEPPEWRAPYVDASEA